MPLVTQSLQPRVILGLMTFGPSESKGAARITSFDEYNRCLDYFQQQGFNEIDTARIYIGGEQEAFTAKANWKQRGLTLVFSNGTRSSLAAINQMSCARSWSCPSRN